MGLLNKFVLFDSIAQVNFYLIGAMGPSKVKRMKELEKENQRLRKAVSDLTLDKLILQESLDYLKPK